MSEHQHHPGRAVLLMISFVLLLLAIATGPFGLVVLVLAGIPIAIVVGLELAAHGDSKVR